MNECSFLVLGTPLPQGSKIARVVAGRAMMFDSANKATKTRGKNALKSWKEKVTEHASIAFHGAPWHGPIELECIFFFARSKSHYTSKGALRKGAPMIPRGDLDKLVRAIGDALSKVVYRDDVQIVGFGKTTKRFCKERFSVGGVDVRVRTI